MAQKYIPHMFHPLLIFNRVFPEKVDIREKNELWMIDNCGDFWVDDRRPTNPHNMNDLTHNLCPSLL